MLPDKAKATPEGRFLHAAALVVAGQLSQEQGAYFAGCSVAELMQALSTVEIAAAVNAEVTRLRYTGDLAALKAAKLTDAMMDKLLATPVDELSTGGAVKFVELGLKFREKAAPEAKPEAPRAEILIHHEGQPEPAPVTDDRYRVIIRLKAPKPARVIEHGERAIDA